MNTLFEKLPNPTALALAYYTYIPYRYRHSGRQWWSQWPSPSKRRPRALPAVRCSERPPSRQPHDAAAAPKRRRPTPGPPERAPDERRACTAPPAIASRAPSYYYRRRLSLLCCWFYRLWKKQKIKSKNGKKEIFFKCLIFFKFV